MTMRYVVKLSLATLLLACLAVSAQAAQFFPLETGRWMEMDKQDKLGNKWTVRMMVFEETTMDNTKQYFRVQELYYDPYGINGGDTFSEFYLRSTDTELYFYNGPGLGETLGFRTGQVDDFWEYTDESGTIRKEIVSTNDSITIPYGGTYTAYQYKHFNINDPNRYDLEWVVPGLGMAKEEDHWVDQSQSARIPLTSVLARVGSNPLLFPLKTGMRLIFNVSDAKNNKWQMRMQILEQVSIGGKTYFHGRQTNYDPIGGDLQRDFYIRSTDKEVYVFDGVSEHIEFQAAGPGTSWDFPQQGGTLYKQITAITPINVLGGSYLAYVHDSHYEEEPDFVSPHFIDYMVPGLGPAQMIDWWIEDPTRAPLTFTLTQITQGSASTAVNLLLLD